MPIVSSRIVSKNVQIDGRFDITEEHVDQNGKKYIASYLAGVETDVYAVLSARAAHIGADIDSKAAIELEAQNYEVPLTYNEFLDLLTISERIAIRNAAITNPVINDMLDYLKRAGTIYRKVPLGQKTIDGLNYLVTQNLLTAERVSVILGTV